MTIPLADRGNTDELDQILDRLSDPATASYALGIIENLEALYLATVSLNELIHRGEVIVDSLSTGLQELREGTAQEGKSGLEGLKELFKMYRTLGDRSEVLGSLLRNDLLDENFLGGLTVLSRSLSDTRQVTKGSHASRIKGIGSLLKSLKDADVQQGLDFAVELLRALGRNNQRS
ncbi:MAG: DUF1641 domain-containing protein [Ferrimicrobium sp.]|jgi:hypothetical protein|uniref:DUF1641 domain-containing protein n=1 Tax=Ferrimicrobium acidiphilum TaxID=121039 RepID=A0ABV3Y4P2_9ACTN|nr:DUF1641 domain-containing protein [Ferrimicrobium sp.]MCL5973041.1 DUF1641 domain-containing protein [Actinomycetota bacterium]